MAQRRPPPGAEEKEEGAKAMVVVETVGMEVAMRDEANGADVSAAKKKFKQCEEKLEGHTRMVLDSLDQVSIYPCSPLTLGYKYCYLYH